MLAMWGALGFGVVWGWLLGLLSISTRRPVRSALVGGGATLLSYGLVFMMLGWRAALASSIAGGISLGIYTLWQRGLMAQFGSHRA